MRITLATRFKPEDEWETTTDTDFDGTFAEYMEFRKPNWEHIQKLSLKDYIQQAVDAGTLKIIEPANWKEML